MARTRLAKEFLGRPVPEESLRQYARPVRGRHRDHRLRGPALRCRLFIGRGSPAGGWRRGPRCRWSKDSCGRPGSLFLWSGAALLSLSLLIAFGVGRLMAAPIGAARCMRAPRSARASPCRRISSTLREADELSLVLSNAAKELDVRMGAQAHLAAIVSSSPSAVVSLSPAGIIRTWNAAATSPVRLRRRRMSSAGPIDHVSLPMDQRGCRQAQWPRSVRLRRARGRCAPAQGRPA